jgi:hypothetical protein
VLQHTPGGQNGRTLTEGEQPGYVRKDERRIGYDRLERDEIRIAQDDDRGAGKLVFDAHVHTANGLHGSLIPFQNETLAHFALDANCLFWR